ncbi:MAG: 3-deoxy-D-manno-octulosonic acid transferase [Thiotrichales bacterium]|nr:3-deoxy-D-manno-octulosonic acid transferase [Thiotrichales bacterium]
MRFLYSLAHYLAVPFICGNLLWRSLRNPAYLQRWPERFGFSRGFEDGRDCIWVHAVSVGEVQAAVPVVKGLQHNYPDCRVLVTTTTPTGCARVAQVFGDDVSHRYMTYDLPDAVTRFLDRFRPRVGIIFETELWPNMLHYCRKLSIPMLLANARLSERSATGYRRFPALSAQMLGNISAIAAQSEDDAARLIDLGANPDIITVTGSIKFDVRLPASLFEQAEVVRRVWGVHRSVWVAASTHEGEDELILSAFDDIRSALPGTLLVLVPRHPERFARVVSMCRKRGLNTAQRSENPQSCSEINVLVGDTMGELPLFYAAADVAFVGGSLVPIGGHNMLEPAALGVPVVFGPEVFNFADISRRLTEVGAARQIPDAGALAPVITELLSDANLRHSSGQQGREFVERNGGAGEQVLALIDELCIQAD